MRLSSKRSGGEKVKKLTFFPSTSLTTDTTPLPPPPHTHTHTLSIQQPLRCWNQNSHDTGGIVGNNWLDIMWNKIAWLEKATGLSPWWRRAAADAGVVTSNPPPPKIVPMPTQSRGVQPYCSDLQPAPQYSCPQHMAWGE